MCALPGERSGWLSRSVLGLKTRPRTAIGHSSRIHPLRLSQSRSTR